MIRAIITDFDGTLVDTFEANLKAYQEAFHQEGFVLSPQEYRKCFGLRFDRFMRAMGIDDERVATNIHQYKNNVYPGYFACLKLNSALMELIASFHAMGGKTAIASTAQKENLENAVSHLGIGRHFDAVYAGVDVKESKPAPEIYLKAMAELNVTPGETLIFEDSDAGIEAARRSGAHLMAVMPESF